MSDGFGRLLRRVREGQGVSQERAVRAATSQAYISGVETGRVALSIDRASRLLACLGYEIELSARPMPMRSDPDTLARLEALTPEERIERSAAAHEFQALLRDADGA